MARPKRVFTDEEIEQMERHALNGGQNGTIATAMDIPFNTLKRRFGKRLSKKRAERKLLLRLRQTLLAVSNPAMAIFLGKNELNQVDKQEIRTETKVVEEFSPEERARLKHLAGLADGLTVHRPLKQAQEAG